MVALLSWLVYKLSQVKGEAGVDTGDLDANEVAELFGKSQDTGG